MGRVHNGRVLRITLEQMLAGSEMKPPGEPGNATGNTRGSRVRVFDPEVKFISLTNRPLVRIPGGRKGR